jgi:hypothetical protein
MTEIMGEASDPENLPDVLCQGRALAKELHPEKPL